MGELVNDELSEDEGIESMTRQIEGMHVTVPPHEHLRRLDQGTEMTDEDNFSSDGYGIIHTPVEPPGAVSPINSVTTTHSSVVTSGHPPPMMGLGPHPPFMGPHPATMGPHPAMMGPPKMGPSYIDPQPHSPIPMMPMGPARQTRNSRKVAASVLNVNGRSPTTTTTTTQTKTQLVIQRRKNAQIRLSQATTGKVLTASPPAPSVAGVETVHTTHTTFIRKGLGVRNTLAKERKRKRKKVSVATKFLTNKRPVKLKIKIE